jgi:hypothetical protein
VLSTDRLVQHHAKILELTGESYRERAAKVRRPPKKDNGEAAV